jgi:penicillin amidase
LAKKFIRRSIMKKLLITAAVLIITVCFIIISVPVSALAAGAPKVEGLSAPVEIYRDPDGVPHIYAETMEDLLFAQGYVHAQDRFWQMEFWRRIGSGRLSELFGDAVMGVDIYIRTVNFRGIAEKEYEMMDEETKRYLEAYSAGVNAYILDKKPRELGLEFRLLKLQGVDFEIEPWTPVNTLTWYKLLAEDGQGNMREELYRIDIIRTVGIKLAQDYFPKYDYINDPIVVNDNETVILGKRPKVDNLADLTDEDISLLLSLNTGLVGGFDPYTPLALGKGEGVGSNAWVFSGDMTATGKPILANDPHLGIQMPSIWYEVGLHSKTGGGPDGTEPFNLRGYSMAGSPWLILGHNDRIAWSMCFMYPDAQDLYIERINPQDPNQYEVNGRWEDMDIRREEILIKDEDEPFVLLVRSTRNGPIVTDHGSMMSANSFDIVPQKSFPDNLDLTALSLHWSALQPFEIPRSLKLLGRARNFEEFHEALSYLKAPNMQMTYADVNGNIGFQSVGLIPIRPHSGLVPVPGWTDDYEWTGYVPYEDMPWVKNPKKGYIIAANNATVSSNYPYVIDQDSDMGYRARRILEMIEQKGSGFTVEDMKAMQGDNLCTSAAEILPFLEGISFEDEAIAAARDRLFEWDGRMDMDSPDAALYGYFWASLVEEIFKDQIHETLWNKDKALGARSSLLKCVNTFLGEPDNGWWDDVTTLDVAESPDDILARAFEKAYEKGVEELGDNLDRWEWGDIHTATFRNQTFGQSGIKLIERIFNRGPVSVSGGFHQVNRADYSVENAFDVHVVSSMRAIYDMSDLSNSLMIHTTGQSGHIGNSHYDDFIDMWRNNEYHPTRWEKKEATASTSRKMVLKPD